MIEVQGYVFFLHQNKKRKVVIHFIFTITHHDKIHIIIISSSSSSSSSAALISRRILRRHCPYRGPQCGGIRHDGTSIKVSHAQRCLQQKKKSKKVELIIKIIITKVRYGNKS